MELSELISLADRVLVEHMQAEQHPSDEALLLLENYCASFDKWFQDNEKLIRAGEKFNSADLDGLVSRHESILEMAEKLQARFPAQMKELKTRSRGILAYTDILPKKISTTRTKEG